MKEEVRRLIDSGNYERAYILTRFLYRISEETISDKEYFNLEKKIKELGICEQYLTRTYDDDPLPLSLIEHYNLNHLIPDFSFYQEKYRDSLDSEKSLSIKAIESIDDLYNYMTIYGHMKLIFSGKVDGINIKSKLSKEEKEKLLTNKVSLTRGRIGESFDVTKNLNRILPSGINLDKDSIKVTGECYVDRRRIKSKTLVAPSGTVIKVSRSGANSMLRTNYKDSDYNDLYYSLFDVDYLTDSREEDLKILESLGFDIVLYKVIEPNEAPRDKEKFKEWLLPILDWFKDESDKIGMPLDGVVVDLDDKTFNGVINGQYNSKNLAIKFYHWSPQIYKGIVKQIVPEQKGSECSLVAIIEPLELEDDTEARRVNLHSLRIVINERILPGKEIYFERKSSNINIMLHGERLKELMGVI